jgi:hypothetical protein
MILWTMRDPIINRTGQSLLYSSYVHCSRLLVRDSLLEPAKLEPLGFSLTSTHSTPEWSFFAIKDSRRIFLVVVLHTKEINPIALSKYLSSLPDECNGQALILVSQTLTQASSRINDAALEMLPMISGGLVYSAKALGDLGTALQSLSRLRDDSFWPEDPRLLAF